MVKNPPVVLEMQEMWVPPLGWEDPLEKGMETHFGILGWRIPQTRGAWLAIFHGVANSRTQLSTHVRMHTHMRAHTHTHTQSKVKISILQVSRAGCMFPNRSDC